MTGDTKFQWRETKNLYDDLFHKGQLCECGHSVFAHVEYYINDSCGEALCKCKEFTPMSNLTFLVTRPRGAK